jgi:secondary thiamine-phosphate synthase enzyme
MKPDSLAAACRVRHHCLQIGTRGKGTTNITGKVQDFVRTSGITEGVLTVFVRHTSSGLVIMENADPSAGQDLHEFFDRLVPEGTPWFQHTCEGPDDMPSHIRMAPSGVPLKHEYV